MKKGVLSRAMALGLGTVMIASALVGCKSADRATNSDSSQNDKVSLTGTEEKSTEEKTATEVAGIEGWKAFDHQVSLKVPVYDRGVEGVPDVKDNYWTKWIQENFGDKYNISVEYIPITRTAVENDYALLAASENLPTILMEYDYPKLAKWAADGYLQEYDLDAFKQVAPNYYAQMEENKQLDYTQMNGVRYFAMAERPYYNTTPNFLSFVRMDWLEQVGYDHIPLNRAEYLDAMQKIMDAGIAEHPGGGCMTGLGAQVYDTREFPMDEEEWAMYGDFSIPSMSWYANKKVVKKANEDYNAGITNPEYYVTDETTAQANFVAGKTYSYGAYMAADMAILNSFYAQNPDAKLAVYTTYGEDQKLKADPGTGDYPIARADNPFGMLIGFSSFATEDELKAAWMYMEWMTEEDVLFQMQWGVEGENFTYDADGNPVTESDYEGDYKMGYNNNKDYWCISVEQRNFGDIYQNIKMNSPKGYPQDFTDEIIASYDLNVKRAELGYAVNDAMFAVEIASENEYRTKLQELYKEYVDELTMCAPEDFDARYDELAQKYLDAGYQEVLDERKAAYEAGNTTHLLDIQKK